MKKIIILLLFFPSIFLAQSPENREETMNDKLFLLDDFSKEVSTLGTSWQGFSDRVMGGISDLEIFLQNEDNNTFLRMKGNVSLKNNGGFIQVRLRMDPQAKAWDASDYQGIELEVRGLGEDYYIFLRTSQTKFPWKFYQAKIPLSEQWQKVRIPWTAFGSGDFGVMRKLNISKLKSLAIVAYKKEFEAQIDINSISLYK